MSTQMSADEPKAQDTADTAPAGDMAGIAMPAGEDAPGSESPESEGTDWREQAEGFVRQAKDAARNAATTAKTTTGEALHGLSKIIGDTAAQVDDKLGEQYGSYARKAADAVAGAAKSLDEKDIDQLAEDAREFVRKSPAVAIGAAAIVGFVLMRMMRGSSSEDEA